VELFVFIPHISKVSYDAFLILGGPLIRAFAFGTIGLIVNRLVAIQRNQRKELILANIRLSEHAQTLEQLATSSERNRLARELHDTLAHTLSGQAVNLEAIKLMVPPDMSEIHQMLEQSLLATRGGLAETRRALRALRSERLEKRGVKMAINDLANDASSRDGFSLNLDLPNSFPELTPDVEQTLYRITQEALENIIRHAQASYVELVIEQLDDKLSLSIIDDGIGFDPQSDEIIHKLGIHGMRERAALVGGVFSILSNPGNGTTIRFSIPLQ
jgi:signal transduction histidine kinase